MEKLSHLRAQIKRQASKAAKSRIEERTSVGAVNTTNASPNQVAGVSANSGGMTSSRLAGNSGANLSDNNDGTGSKLANESKDANYQPSSSTESSIAYLKNPSTSSPLGPNSGQSDALINSSSLPGAHHEVSGGHKHTTKLLNKITMEKLSHLRAQIKRQASKAARSRFEKRSSVGAVNTTNTSPNQVAGVSASSGAVPTSRLAGNSGANLSDNNDGTGSKLANESKDANYQPSSSTESSIAYLKNPSTSSPLGPNSGQSDALINSSSLPGAHHEVSGGHKHSSHLIPGNHHHHSISVNQKNFKQKLIALIKKFRTDDSDFGSEEQYREALERELMNAAAGRGSRAIEELLEEEIDVEAESDSDLEDWDNISESSTPKPSLRPFFSSTTLDKI